MSEKSRREQKLLGIFMASAVMLAALTTLYLGFSDAIWWVMTATLYVTVIGVVIFAELIDEADIETRKKLGTYIEPNTDLPEELVTGNRMSSSYISMTVRKKFEECMETDQLQCKKIDCEDCNANIPDDVFDALIAERETKIQ